MKILLIIIGIAVLWYLFIYAPKQGQKKTVLSAITSLGATMSNPSTPPSTAITAAARQKALINQYSQL